MIYKEVLWSETISLCKKLNIITCNQEHQANELILSDGLIQWTASIHKLV